MKSSNKAQSPVVAVIVMIAVTIVLSIVLYYVLTTSPCTYHTIEGKIINVENSAGGLGRDSITTIYFEDGTVMAFKLTKISIPIGKYCRINYEDSRYSSLPVINSIEILGV